MSYPELTKKRGAKDEPSAQKIFSLLNSDRGRAGFKPVERNSDLDAVALSWSKKMAKSGKISHNPHARTQVPTNWRALGENVAYNSAASDNTGMSLYYLWMVSDGHRENVLRSTWTDIGIGIYIDESGQHWGTQVFATYPTKTRTTSPGTSTSKKPSATITGFSKGITVAPRSTVTWSGVTLSTAGKLQQLKGKKWQNVRSLKKGRQNLKIKVGAKAGTSTKYRIRIAGNAQRKTATSPTVTIRTKAKPTVKGFKATKTVKRSQKIKWKSVSLSHSGVLQQRKSNRWVTVKRLASGKQSISIKAPKRAGTLTYRIHVPARSKNLASRSTNVKVLVKR